MNDPDILIHKFIKHCVRPMSDDHPADHVTTGKQINYLTHLLIKAGYRGDKDRHLKRILKKYPQMLKDGKPGLHKWNAIKMIDRLRKELDLNDG